MSDNPRFEEDNDRYSAATYEVKLYIDDSLFPRMEMCSLHGGRYCKEDYLNAVRRAGAIAASYVEERGLTFSKLRITVEAKLAPGRPS